MANDIIRLIDANAVLKEMQTSGRAAYMIVQEAPTIHPESLIPKGRWVYCEENMEMSCSECGCAAHVRCGYWYDYILSDYCPNCGAKMEG